MPLVLAADLSQLRVWRVGWLVVLCAIVALLVAMAAPSRADAARVQCAGTFRVLHDDHIGALTLPRGNYRIAILDSGQLSCAWASTLFTRFLEDYDGRLPGVWRIAAGSTFEKAPGVGFQATRVGGYEGGSGGSEEGDGEGEGRHPVAGSFCPGTFRVLHRDRIGPLRFAAGRYWIVLLQPGRLSCARASTLFTRFLDDVSGSLPPPWFVEVQSASFGRSPGDASFRIKPVV